jgi:hypothetical protein
MEPVIGALLGFGLLGINIALRQVILRNLIKEQKI